MSENTGIDWVAVINVGVNIVIPLLAAFLFPYLRRLFEQASERSKYADLAAMAAQVVLAAEQQFGTGTERLEYATTLLAQHAGRRGIAIDERTLRALVEAAVYTMNRGPLSPSLPAMEKK